MKLEKIRDSRKYILISDLKKIKEEELPKDWFLGDNDIEEKIKKLRREIRILQNSRKKQPKLLIFEGKDKLERVRVFQGFKIVDLNKGLFIADNWYEINKKYQVDELRETFEFGKETKEYLEKFV